MAREQRKDVDYFPHECTHGRKMHIIEAKYGNDGYATWFKLLEQLGKANNHYIDFSDEMTLMFLTSVFKIDEEKTINILTDLSKLGAIDKVLFEEYKVIYSHKFCESVQDAYRNRKGKILQYSDVLDEINAKNVQSYVRLTPKDTNLTEVIPKVKYSKVKESKEEESKEESTNVLVGLKNQPKQDKINFQNLLIFFNENRGNMPAVKILSEKRKKKVLATEKQHGKQSILDVIKKTKESPHLQGVNDRGWTATFDWIFEPANFIKILEGNYEKRNNGKNNTTGKTDVEHKQSAVNSVNALFGVR